MEGIVPFVYGAIKKRRKRADCYERLSTGAARGREHFTGGAYHSQSCWFAVRSPANELCFPRDDWGCRAPPEDLWCELFSPTGRNGERGLSKSLRFSSMRVFACVSGA